MQIPIWKATHTQVARFPVDFDAYDLYDARKQFFGRLCVEKIPLPIETLPAFCQLQRAMMAALNLCYMRYSKAQTLSSGNWVIIMGDALCREFCQSDAPLDTLRAQNPYRRGYRALVTYHPLTLLQSPEYKAKAWFDLKKIRTFVKSSWDRQNPA